MCVGREFRPGCNCPRRSGFTGSMYELGRYDTYR